MVTLDSPPLRPDCDTTRLGKHVGGCDSLTKSKQQTESRRRHNIIVLYLDNMVVILMSSRYQTVNLCMNVVCTPYSYKDYSSRDYLGTY
jgi:hypothetical protein